MLAAGGQALAVHVAADGVGSVFAVDDNVIEDRRRLHPAQAADGEQRRGLHIRAERALARPVGAFRVVFLVIEALVAVDDADVAAAAEVLRRVHAEAEQPVVRHGGIFGMDVGLRRAVVTDGAAAEDQIAQPDALLQRAAGADADGGLHADVVQLLHADAGGRAADARGDGEDRDAAVGAGQAAELAVVGKLAHALQLLRDAVEPGRVAGQDGIADAQGLIQTDMRLLHA